jgi:ribose-phosphate pyrophosphokinase
MAYCTHPVLSGPANDRILASHLDEIVVTDTIPLSAASQANPKIRVVSIAPLLGETLQRISRGESVMSMFTDSD